MAIVIPEAQQFDCRICLEKDDIKNLIHPCKCRGTVKYVHEKCLIQWIETTGNNLFKKKCSICNENYLIIKKANREKFMIDITIDVQHIVGEIIFAEVIILIFTFVLAALDHTCGIKSTRVLSLNMFKTDNFDRTLNTLFNQTYTVNNRRLNKDNAVLFYINYTHYISYFTYLNLFFIMCYIRVKNRYLYWRYMKIKIALAYIYFNLFPILFNLLMWSDDYQVESFFCIVTTIFCFFNYFGLKAILILHNDGLKKINGENQSITILSVQNNPLNELV